MSKPPFRALRVVLGILFVLVTVGGLVMILGPRPLIVRVFMGPPESEVSTLLLVALKEIGGLALMFSVMLWFAARDPARNVAVVDAVIAGLCILAVTPVLSLYTLDMERLYPGWLVWVRSIVRVALAALLYYLRPEPATDTRTSMRPSSGP
jgi:hypothetical protein